MPVLTPRSFMLVGTEDEVAAGGQRLTCVPVTPAEALELCPALVPGILRSRRAGHRILRLRRAPAAGRTTGRQPWPPGRTSSPAPRVHSAQRLGTGWQVGAGTEGFAATVVVNAAGAWADELAVISGVEKLGLQPYRRTAAIAAVDRSLPAGSPMVAAADDSFYFRPDGGDVLISPSETRAQRPRGRPTPPRRRGKPGGPAQPGDDAGHHRRPPRLDRAPDRGGRRRPRGRVRRGGRRASTGSPGRAGTGSRRPPPWPNLPRGRSWAHTGQPGSARSGIPDSTGARSHPLVRAALKNGSMSTLITNIAELMTQDLDHRVLEGRRRGARGGADRLDWAPPRRRPPQTRPWTPAGGPCCPAGWTPTPTCLFAGDRTAEFEARMAGEAYAAGGIAVTMAATRATADYDLTRLALGRVAEAVSAGHHLPGDKDRLRAGRRPRGPQRPDRLHRGGPGDLPRRAPGAGRPGPGGLHGPGLRADAGRRPALCAVGGRVL